LSLKRIIECGAARQKHFGWMTDQSMSVRNSGNGLMIMGLNCSLSSPASPRKMRTWMGCRQKTAAARLNLEIAICSAVP